MNENGSQVDVEADTNQVMMAVGASKEGGPVSPTRFVFTNGESLTIPGMTLRDHFAGLAMQALLHPGNSAEWLICTYGTHEMSAAAYKQADAMLKARAL